MELDPYQGVRDRRLTPDDFRQVYGGYRSCALWGARWIGSAILDDGTFIYFDHDIGDYATEK